MTLYSGNKPIKVVYIGDLPIEEAYKGNKMVWHREFPVGTVLLEQVGEVINGQTLIELILPTTQTYEITLVGGGGGYNGCQADI